MFIPALLLITVLIAFISFFEEVKDLYVVGSFVTAGIVLLLLAGFKPIGIDPDSLTYVSYYHGQNDDFVDPSYVFVVDLIRATVATPIAIFVFYAFISVPIKLYGITRLTPLWMLSLVAWISNYFILQELTQIRAAVSTGLLLIAIYFLADGRRWLYLLMCLLATVAHSSGLVLLPFVFLGNKPLSKRWLYTLASLPLLGYLFYFLKLDVSIVSFIPFFADKIEVYESMRDSGFAGADINVFNSVFLLKVAVFYLLLWKHRIITAYVRCTPLMLKFLALSVCAFSMFSFLPVLAFRVSEIYGIVEIIMAPTLIYIVKPRWVGRVLVLVYFFGVALINIFYNELLIPV